MFSVYRRLRIVSLSENGYKAPTFVKIVSYYKKSKNFGKLLKYSNVFGT